MTGGDYFESSSAKDSGCRPFRYHYVSSSPSSTLIYHRGGVSSILTQRDLFTYGAVSIEDAEKVPLKETEIGMIPEHWAVVRLGEVVIKTKQKNPENTPEWEFKYIDVSGISREILAISDYKSYIGKEAPSRAKKLIETGDVIFATVRPTLKRIALIDDRFDGQICSTAFCVLRANRKKTIPYYIYHIVSREHFVNELGKIQRGASYPAVTDTDVKNQKIPLPTFPEQQQIAKILTAIDEKINAEQTKRNSLDTLFKTLPFPSYDRQNQG